MWQKLEVVIKATVRQKSGHAIRGRHKSPAGYDLADQRHFEIGDSPRSVNRRHLAKFGELRVVEKFPDRRAAVLFVVDVSSSEGLGTVRSKREASLDAAVGLGVACMARGHLVRLLAFTDRIEHEGRYLSSYGLWDDEVHLVRTLVPRGTLTDPVPALERSWELCQGTASADMVCIISDFLFPHPQGQRLEDIGDHADVIAIIASDPMEVGMPPIAGTFVFRDVETGEMVYAAGIANEDPSAYLNQLNIDRCRISTGDDEFRQFARLQEFFQERAETTAEKRKVTR